MLGQDAIARWRDQIRAARADHTALLIQGSGSKRFLGPAKPVPMQLIDTRDHHGIVHYDPTELVLTARAGTSLALIEAALAEHRQMLAFEPPHLGPGATLGGAVASGLAGPRRPWAGAVRDFVLGCRLVDAEGELLRFGGEVMKNVAGYDLSRLMAGSYGSLALIADVSLKVLPVPRARKNLSLAMNASQALQALAQWRQTPLPLSAACHDGQQLHLRLEGGEGSVADAALHLGGEPLDEGFWQALNEQRHRFFASGPVWRLALPPGCPELALPGQQWLDWGGCQRWLCSDEPAQRILQAAKEAGGHARPWRNVPGQVPHALEPRLLPLHQRLKAAFDPHGVFNPGWLHPEV